MQTSNMPTFNFLKVSFIPGIYVNGDDEHRKPIYANIKNYTKMMEFIRSKLWEDFLKYCFDKLRPYILPYYTPEMYYTDNIITQLDVIENVIVVVITGVILGSKASSITCPYRDKVIKKYTYQQVYDKYINDDALNKTWTKNINEKITSNHVKKLIKDGFHKFTNNGEVLIPNIGRLSIKYSDRIKFKLINI